MVSYWASGTAVIGPLPDRGPPLPQAPAPTDRLNGQGLGLQLGLQHGALSLNACSLRAGLGLCLGGAGALHSSAGGSSSVRQDPGEGPALPTQP